MERITIKDLTSQEKLRLICGQDFWHTADLEGKLPQVSVSDGPVGLRTVRMEGETEKTLPSVAYPCVQSLANTWNRDLAGEMGEALADDCIEREVDILLAPGVNIKRHPLNGRNFEYFSEDPYLAGTMAKEYITGVQEHGVGTCLKHFCCNNLEYNRFNQSSEVDERTLREIYYRPFELACEAKPVSVMSSYNRVNGVYASENEKGFKVLRDEFGFDGAIFSDWDAVRDRTAAARAGLDIEMPFHPENYEKLVKDYEAGLLTDAQLDACAARVLELIYRCHEMKEGRFVQRSVEERLDIARRIAQESIVLLKNDGVLPLKQQDRVAVCGCYARPETGMIAGGGSSQVVWKKKGFRLDELLQERLDGAVPYENMFSYGGVVGHGDYGCNPEKGLAQAAASDVSIVCVGTGAPFEYESVDRQTMRLSQAQERAICELAEVNPRTVVVIFAGSAVDVSAWADKVAAIVYAGFCGEMGGEALADILTGKACPSGRLSETFPMNFQVSPAAQCQITTCATRYSEGLDVGYRYYASHPERTRFPFGYGLSYAEFVYRDLKVERREENVYVSVEVENISDVTAREVVQLYVREYAPVVYRPLRELKAYEKVLISAHEKKVVAFTLDSRAFAYYSTAQDAWTVNHGLFGVEIGRNAQEMILTEKITY